MQAGMETLFAVSPAELDTARRKLDGQQWSFFQILITTIIIIIIILDTLIL